MSAFSLSDPYPAVIKTWLLTQNVPHPMRIFTWLPAPFLLKQTALCILVSGWIFKPLDGATPQNDLF
ncbi:hypothetical protein GCD22_01450 [Acidithiobacillus thiooxidans ATCC 19377]|uniref:Uncharacterized protein n=1 Tax=Acidithiobacillus thiooxidans ATCC 19377 TaxID=637390 RepID=A0A5P9XQE4_ACITH|nr:hypothetical protein GCD22_01450 [Acidithiobacillus thiooxidans ATCC 19377]